MTFADFATVRMPLRPSALPALMRCPLQVYLTMISDAENRSGPAADLGTAVHFAAQRFHTERKGDSSLCITDMHANESAYPLADLDKAADIFRAYAADTRNQEEKVIACEAKVETRLSPSPNDPTQAEIVICGTCDQVREVDGELVLCDIKTGTMHRGRGMLDCHALQLMAYQLGASALLGRNVTRARIIRTADYATKPPGIVHWPAVWCFRDIDAAFNGVREQVARVRSGILYANPSEYCQWCEHGGVANCVPLLTERVERGRNALVA